MEQTSWPAAVCVVPAHGGQDWRPLPVSAGKASTASRWQSRARPLRSTRALVLVQPPPGWRLELRWPAAATGFAFFTPRKPAADEWRCVSHSILKTHRRSPCSLQKAYAEKTSSCNLPTKEPTVSITTCDSILPTHTDVSYESIACSPPLSLRGFWRGTQRPGVWALQSRKPGACNWLPVPAAPRARLERPAWRVSFTLPGK